MIRIFRKTLLLALGVTMIAGALATAGCASGGGYTRSSIRYDAGYRGLGGRNSWGRNPIFIGGGIGGGIGTSGAAQMPEMGAPDMGSMDIGGFDE